MESILHEVQQLSDQGVREVTLLGQNVNSYCDKSAEGTEDCADAAEPVSMSRGFRSICKPKPGGYRFVDLLDRVSLVDENMRIRFTSPHPKDFPDELLFLMQDRPNICKHIHLPAQSGSSTALERMRRGYTRQAYLDLVARIRQVIPAVAISSDFIAGFCGETAAEHHDTLSLLTEVDYDMAYMYAYSMREKTMAHRRYTDDVPDGTKQARLHEIIQAFYSGLVRKVARRVGERELVLVEGPSKKSDLEYCGRTDGNQMVVFRRDKVAAAGEAGGEERCPVAGDYIEVEIAGVRGATLVTRPLCVSSIPAFTRGQ